MKSHLQVAVIGGGVVGCSVLYHLTKLGCKDVALLERKELTAGSSWHAAGGFHAVNADPNISALQAYTIALYDEIQEVSGQDAGIHMTGGINVAATENRWEFLRTEWARHRVLGIDSELVTPKEIAELCPLMDTSSILGGLYDPKEGHLDPSGTTLAYAKAARVNGAEIYRHTKVEELRQRPDGSWDVVTDQGTIVAEHVVNAAGLWARELGAMVGLNLPVMPMEHHYLLTESLPTLEKMDHEIPLMLDLDGEIYLRQEHKGVLLGLYETPATPWALDGTPWDYAEDELLQPDLDRLADSLATGFKRFPEVEAAGIRRIVNGPFTFTPDGNPLVGPVAGLKGYWCACGVMAGFAQGGGVGLALSKWIVEGDPGQDIFAMDVGRFGDFATTAYTLEKTKEFYERRFRIAFPNETWPAGRPSKVTPLYERQKSRGIYSASFGQEIPLFFVPEGQEPVEQPSFRRSNAFAIVAEECRQVREAVGMVEAATFAKYVVEGAGAEAWLDRMMACRLPGVGRIRLAPMLSPSGRLMGDLTVMRLAEDRFMIFGSGYLQTWHMRWFRELLPERGVALRNVTDDLLGFAIAGPNARELLRRVTAEDVSNEALRFMSVREMDAGLAPAVVARLSVAGELGYEIYVPAQYLVPLYDRLHAAGTDLGLRDYGMYALNSLRLEKSFGIWSREFTPDYTPMESGMDRFVAYDKADFVGRDAALAEREAGTTKRRLVTLDIAADDADVWGYEPVWRGETYAGFVTSGGYGHAVGKSLAMGYLSSEMLGDGAEFEVHVLGERKTARVLSEPPYDPQGARLRG